MEHRVAASSARDHALQRLAAALLERGYVFITPTPATHARVNARPGNAWAEDLAGVFGWSRPFQNEVLPAEVEAAAHDAGVLVPCEDGWRSVVRLSTLDGLGFWHSAYPTLAAEAVFFGPDTYRFARALTGWLGTAAPPRRSVDLGAGAGAGGMLIGRAHPGCETLMVDINPEAVRLARINAAVAGLPFVRSVQADLFEGVEGSFDLIVSNPPYLPDRLHRTYRDGGGALGEGLSLRIVAEAAGRLAPGGTLLLYTGTAIVAGKNPFLDLAGPVLDQARLTWRAEEIDPDVFGEELDAGGIAAADRIAAIVLTATRPG